MFNVGDIVEISYHGPKGLPMPESPCLNLEGTTAEIIGANYLGYKLRFINVYAKNWDKFDTKQATFYWQDRHLIPARKPVNIDEADILTLVT